MLEVEVTSFNSLVLLPLATCTQLRGSEPDWPNSIFVLKPQCSKINLNNGMICLTPPEACGMIISEINVFFFSFTQASYFGH